MKFSGARGAAKVMAAHLSPMIGAEAGNMIIVPVPTAASRVRGRGYDQAKLLARELSRQTRLSYVECLVRSGHSRQVGTSRQQRLRQMHGVFRVRDAGKSYSLHKRYVLLIDDVMTTGATLEAAAKALKAHGAGRVSATVFARA